MIRSAIHYGRYALAVMASGPGRALLLRHWKGMPAGSCDHRTALREAVSYLLRAQQQGSDPGMGSYHLVAGWGASYPETTGYAIPTLFDTGRSLNWEEPIHAALRAADWLLAIQRADGGWQGGRIGEGRPSIVFNSAQVMRGLLAAHEHTGEAKYLDSALRGGLWIASVQDGDGAWRASNFMGEARVYDTYVDAPLLRMYSSTGEEKLRIAAVRNLEWVLSQQHKNGWFANADNTIRHNQRPITHTIAYTLDGLLESGEVLSERRYVEAALKPAKVLASIFLNKGIRGRYDARWNGSEHPIMTGCAQLAIVWTLAYRVTGEAVLSEAAEAMINMLCSVQRMSEVGSAAVHGALPGSFPLWGRYEKFAFPNWGTKYFADALLCSEGGSTAL